MGIGDDLRNRARKRAQRNARLDEQAQQVRAAADAQAQPRPDALEAAPSKRTPASLTHVYSSRDDVLSVFEDAQGHLVAVHSRRLA